MYSGVEMPQQAPTASGWVLQDYRTVQARSGPAQGGLCTLELEQLDGDELWMVDHAVVACSSTSTTSLRLYEGVVSDLALLDGSDTGNFDVADWPAGLQVRPSQRLIAQWSGASVAAVGTLTLQLRVLRRRR